MVHQLASFKVLPVSRYKVQAKNFIQLQPTHLLKKTLYHLVQSPPYLFGGPFKRRFPNINRLYPRRQFHLNRMFSFFHFKLSNMYLLQTVTNTRKSQPEVK